MTQLGNLVRRRVAGACDSRFCDLQQSGRHIEPAANLWRSRRTHRREPVLICGTGVSRAAWGGGRNRPSAGIWVVGRGVVRTRGESDMRELATAGWDFWWEWIVFLRLSVNRCQTTVQSSRIAAGEVFHQVSCGCNAFGGFGHPGGDLAGPGGTLRGQDDAQVCE
jgi:hypothetical protein